MSVTPTFVGGASTDYAEPTPWYKNKTVWIVGGGFVAIVIFYYLYSQNSSTGTTAAVATPTTTSGSGTGAANELASIEQLQTTDAQILAALQSGQTSGQGSSGGSGASSGGSGGGSSSGGGSGALVGGGGISPGPIPSNGTSPPAFPTIGGSGTQNQGGGTGATQSLYNGEVLSQTAWDTYQQQGGYVPGGTQFHFMGNPSNGSTTGVVQLPGESLIVPSGYVDNPTLGLVPKT